MKKMKYMKYFLDHPQIKRGKTVGNGNSAGSYRYGSQVAGNQTNLAQKIGLNWGSRTKEAPKPQKSSGGINFFRNKFSKLTGK